MALQAFTKRFEDNSTQAGFQFTFNCDICGAPYKSQFYKSKSYKEGNILKELGSVANIVASMDPKYSNVANTGSREANTESQRFSGMSAEWHKEHEEAFAKAQNEAMGHFKQCPKCHRYVDDKDWNAQEGVCVQDLSKPATGTATVNPEPQTGQAVETKSSAAPNAPESKQVICPNCGKPAGTGKFCNNCGAPLMMKCPSCGAQNPVGSKFCGDCGTKLA